MVYGFNDDKGKVGVLPLTGGTVSGNTTFENSIFVNTATVNAGTDYTTSKLRNIMLSTTTPASTVGNNGDICIVYTA